MENNLSMETRDYTCVLKQRDLLNIGLSCEDACPMCSKHAIERTIGEHPHHPVDFDWTPHIEISPCPEITREFAVGKSYKEMDRLISEYQYTAMASVESLSTTVMLRVDQLYNNVEVWAEKGRKQIIRQKRKIEKNEVVLSKKLDIDRLMQCIPQDIIRYIGEFILPDPSIRLKLLETVDCHYSILRGISKMTIPQIRILALNVLYRTTSIGFDSFYFKKGDIRDWWIHDCVDTNVRAKKVIKSLSKSDLVISIRNKLSGWRPENISLRVAERKINWIEANEIAVANYARCIFVGKMLGERREKKRLERRIAKKGADDSVFV